MQLNFWTWRGSVLLWCLWMMMSRLPSACCNSVFLVSSPGQIFHSREIFGPGTRRQFRIRAYTLDCSLRRTLVCVIMMWPQNFNMVTPGECYKLQSISSLCSWSWLASGCTSEFSTNMLIKMLTPKAQWSVKYLIFANSQCTDGQWI